MCFFFAWAERIHHRHIHTFTNIDKTGERKQEEQGQGTEENQGGNDNKNNNNSRRRRRRREGKGNIFGRFFWSLIRPWTWPWPVWIPFIVIGLLCCGFGGYWFYGEMTTPRGRRVVSDSFTHRLKNMKIFGGTGKSMKQRI